MQVSAFCLMNLLAAQHSWMCRTPLADFLGSLASSCHTVCKTGQPPGGCAVHLHCAQGGSHLYLLCFSGRVSRVQV